MTTPTRPGIPTAYAGVNFRSRLEAKWAAFFDLVGWEWTYEPLDAGGYIPDFLIHGERPMFIEVGPCVTADDYADKAAKPDASAADLRHDVLVVGVSPVAPMPNSHAVWQRRALTAGMLGEYDGESLTWGSGVWAREASMSVIHDSMSYAYRPQGDGDGGSPDVNVSRSWIDALWAKAGNETQWRPGLRRIGEWTR